jgi:hypothetical protein
VTGEDPLPPLTTVSLPAAQFIARQKPFVANFNMHIPISQIYVNQPYRTGTIKWLLTVNKI